MTLGELEAWCKSAKYVETSASIFDSSGNESYTTIYEKDGQFFKIEYCNDAPYEKWNATRTGFVRGEYEIIPVRKASRMVYECEWVE